MSEDLDLLLRDAGTPPTVGLDMARVADVARRRARTRVAAQSLGALSLVGALALGVTALLPDASPIAPITPVETEAPTEAAGPRVHESGWPLVAPIDVAGRLDQVVSVVTAATVVDDEFVLDRYTPDGHATSSTGTSGAMITDPIIGEYGDLWAIDQVGNTVAFREGEQAEILIRSDGDTGWLPIGFSDSGSAFLTEVAVGDAPRPAPTLQVMTEDGLADDPGIDVRDVVAADGFILSAASIPEHVVVVHGDADGTQVHLLRAGGESRLLLDDPGQGRVYTHVTIAGEDAWIVEQGDGGFVDVHTVPLFTEGQFTRTELPIGRTYAGAVTGVDVSDDGAWIVLNVRTEDGVQQGAALVDATGGEGDAMGRGWFLVLDTPGIASLDRAASSGVQTTDLPACATGEDALSLINNPSTFYGAAWFLCWDAMGRLPAGGAHPFVPVTLAADDGPLTDAQMLELLEQWIAGPDAVDVARGLTSPVSVDVIAVDSVTTDGSTVTVDVRDGPQVGVLSTSSGGATFMQGLVGTVLGSSAADELVITLDGSCEAWVQLTLSESGDPSCPTYTRLDTPWGQAASACARDQASLNVAVPSDGVHVLRWCSDASTYMSINGEAFAWSPAATSLSVTPTRDELIGLVVEALSEVREDEPQGLVSGGHLGTTPETLAAGLTVERAGARVLVDFDASLAEALPLTAPFPNYLFETVLASTLLQLEGIDEVQLLLGGSCEAYENSMEQTDGAPCRVLDDSVLPSSVEQ